MKSNYDFDRHELGAIMETDQRAEVAVVTAANHQYFQLLLNLLDSLDDAPMPDNWQKHVLDVGLTEEEISNLKDKSIEVTAADWCIDFPGKEACNKEKRWLQAMVNRPFLPDLLPGHKIYLWIDCDAWVQDVKCLEEIVLAAKQQQAVAIVAERFDRAVNIQYTGPEGRECITSITEQSIRENIARCYQTCFGNEKLHHAKDTIINSGVFAISQESQAWKVWQSYLRQGLSNGIRHTLVEQQALNLAYLDNAAPFNIMQSKYNWNLATLQPVWNDEIVALVDPKSTEDQIGIIHLTDLKRYNHIPIHSLVGDNLLLPLDYKGFKRWRNSRKISSI